MAVKHSITIVGGGLAGLTLGIALRQHGVPVTLWEAGRYPRHRVCGEFVSGRGLAVLSRFGLLEKLRHEQTACAKTARFCGLHRAGRVLDLPQSALCVSRHVLDAFLANHFRWAGGELREGEKWKGATDSAGTVLATGRRLQPVENGWRWFGLKAHARDVALGADLEMHVSADCYVGLCRLPDGLVNVCGLFRRRAGGNGAGRSWQEQLAGPSGSLLSDRLRSAAFFPETFCSVAGITFKGLRDGLNHECRIGDALAMIPPVTGNGMSIAFESALLALQPLLAWSEGGLSWPEARNRIAKQCAKTFANRLRWAGWYQAAMFTPVFQSVLLRFVSRSERFWRFVFERTR